jgi:hypothetical protein
VKKRLRILLVLAYVLALAGHGLEHRLKDAAGATPESCVACAFLGHAGHELGKNSGAPVPAQQPMLSLSLGTPKPEHSPSLPEAKNPHGARAPPRAA